MKYSFCVVQFLSLIYTLAQSTFVHKVYTKSGESNSNGILKEIPMPDHPGEPACAMACKGTIGCGSFRYDDSSGICWLQKNGYGKWIEGMKLLVKHTVYI